MGYATQSGFAAHRSGRSTRRAQQEKAAQLCEVRLIEHAPTAGAASEHRWRQLFERYLPQRYRAAPAFVVDSLGQRSSQVDPGGVRQFQPPGGRLAANGGPVQCADWGRFETAIVGCRRCSF